MAVPASLLFIFVFIVTLSFVHVVRFVGKQSCLKYIFDKMEFDRFDPRVVNSYHSPMKTL